MVERLADAAQCSADGLLFGIEVAQNPTSFQFTFPVSTLDQYLLTLC